MKIDEKKFKIPRFGSQEPFDTTAYCGLYIEYAGMEQECMYPRKECAHCPVYMNTKNSIKNELLNILNLKKRKD